MKTENFRYSWGFGTGLVVDSIKSFGTVWGRMAAIMGIFVVMALLVTGIFAGVGALFLGGISGVENLFANVMVTGNVALWQTWILILLGVCWLLILSVLAIQAYIAQVLVIREAENKVEKSGIVALFFRKSWKHFMPICWGGLRSTWYVLWPILLFGVLAAIFASVFAASEGVGGLAFLWMILLFLLSIFLCAFVVYRSINLLFWAPALVDEGVSGKDSIIKSMALVRGNWWGSFLFLLGVGFLLMLVSLVYQWPLIWTDIMFDPILGYEGWTAYDFVFFEVYNFPFSLYEALTIFDIFLQMFIFAPFYTFFLYKWMVRVRDAKLLGGA